MNPIFRILMILIAVTCIGACTSQSELPQQISHKQMNEGKVVSKNSEDLVQGALAEKIDQMLQTANEGAFSGSILIRHKGKVILAKGYGKRDKAKGLDNNRHTLYDIASISKHITACGILLLEQEGKLNTNDSINKYLPNVPEEKKAVTVFHLLTHTSGLPDWNGLRPHFKTAVTPEHFETYDVMLQAIMDCPLNTPPGKKYRYTNPGYTLLAIIIERVSGMPFEDFILEKVLKPAGCHVAGFPNSKSTRRDPANASKGVKGNSCINYRWNWNGRGPASMVFSVDEMHQWEKSIQENRVLNKKQTEKWFKAYKNNYACGWIVSRLENGNRVMQHSGDGANGFGGWLKRYPDEDSLVAIFSNSLRPSSYAPQVVESFFFPAPPLVRGVAGGTQAEELGLQPGDHIVGYNGKEITCRLDLTLAIAEAKKSEKEIVSMKVMRDGEEISYEIKPGTIGVRLK